jgi:hypothetical protein
MGKIDVASCSIAELFSEKVNDNIRGSLEIPEYQRAYVWGHKEIDKLLSDIGEHNCKKDPKPMYYLGSVILYKHDERLSIIDGQQRITTLAVIQHIKDTNKVPKIKYASPVTIEKIRYNYNYLIDKKAKLDCVDFYKLNVTLVVTENEDDAYTFFETQNTGGVRLSGIDIIKAHHLREISPNGKRDERYAIAWEKMKNLKTVVELLIKARRWNALNWTDVPSDNDTQGIKNSIVEDFSEKTVDKSKKAAYMQIIATDNYSSISVSPYKLAIRQPLANGENFIDYLSQFAELHQRLFKPDTDTDIEIHTEYYNFNRKVIQYVDGTAYIKELYEIALLCYVNKFGVKDLYEASYWIFRYTYSKRVSVDKTVWEKSIPAFIRKNHYIFDIILNCFNHEQVIEQLKNFKYEFSETNTEGNTVKSRFINRVKDYFEGIEKSDYDNKLKTGIASKLKGIKSGR